MNNLLVTSAGFNSINNYVSDISYGYNTTLNLYKANTDKIVRVNPTTVLDSLGMGTDSISGVYSTMMSSNDVFFEMIDNDKLNKQQYDLVAGHWPKNYDELVIVLQEPNAIPDLLVLEDLKMCSYSLGNGLKIPSSMNSPSIFFKF